MLTSTQQLYPMLARQACKSVLQKLSKTTSLSIQDNRLLAQVIATKTNIGHGLHFINTQSKPSEIILFVHQRNVSKTCWEKLRSELEQKNKGNTSVIVSHTIPPQKEILLVLDTDETAPFRVSFFNGLELDSVTTPDPRDNKETLSRIYLDT